MLKTDLGPYRTSIAFEVHEPTGRQILFTDHGNWEGDDYEERVRTHLPRLERSKEEYGEADK